MLLHIILLLYIFQNIQFEWHIDTYLSTYGHHVWHRAFGQVGQVVILELLMLSFKSVCCFVKTSSNNRHSISPLLAHRHLLIHNDGHHVWHRAVRQVGQVVVLELLVLSFKSVCCFVKTSSNNRHSISPLLAYRHILVHNDGHHVWHRAVGQVGQVVVLELLVLSFKSVCCADKSAQQWQLEDSNPMLKLAFKSANVVDFVYGKQCNYVHTLSGHALEKLATPSSLECMSNPC